MTKDLGNIEEVNEALNGIWLLLTTLQKAQKQLAKYKEILKHTK